MTDITELSPAMKAAAKKYRLTLEAYRNNPRDYDTVVAWDEATSEFMELVDNDEFNIISGLVEALEKAQAKATQQGNIGSALFDEVTQLRRHADEKAPDLRAQLIEADSELEALRQRIAELESRTVTIEPFRSFVTDADLAALHRFAECCDDPESGGHDLEKEQVLRLEAIGALRRSGCVHWITGFGDVLISITAGIKWEAE